MNNGSLILASSYVLSAAVFGDTTLGCCIPACPAASAPAVAARPEKRADDPPAHVYRLDFTVTSGEGGAPGVKEQFTLNLADHQHGDVVVGRNVSLQTGGLNGGGGPRTDVGLRLGVDCNASGDEVLLQVRLEVSDTEAAPVGAPVPIHKATASGDVLIKLGQPALAVRLDDGHKQYEVNVTATRLR